MLDSYEQLYMQFQSLIDDPDKFRKVYDEALKSPEKEQRKKVLNYLGPLIKKKIDSGDYDFLEDYYGVLSKQITNLGNFCRIIDRSLIFLLSIDGVKEDFLFNILDECDTLYKLFEKYVKDGKRFKELKYPLLYDESYLLLVTYVYFDKNDIEYSLDISEYEEEQENEDSYSDDKPRKNKAYSDDDYDEDSIKAYLRQIGKIPLLTKEEEYNLGLAILYGDEEESKAARSKLVEHNLRYAVTRAKRRVNGKIDFLDLIQEGNQGLIKAAERFDCEKGFRFTTYATYWVDQQIGRYVQDHSNTIRKPVHYCEKYNKLKKAMEELSKSRVDNPTFEELSKATGFSVNEIKQMLKDFSTPISLSAPVGDERDSEFGDFIEDEESKTVEEEIEVSVDREYLEELMALAKLTNREINVIKTRFGFIDGSTHTLEEIGAMYGVTRERVRQIEAKCLRKLRAAAYRKKKREERQQEEAKKAPVYKPVKNNKKRSDQ